MNSEKPKVWASSVANLIQLGATDGESLSAELHRIEETLLKYYPALAVKPPSVVRADEIVEACAKEIASYNGVHERWNTEGILTIADRIRALKGTFAVSAAIEIARARLQEAKHWQLFFLDAHGQDPDECSCCKRIVELEAALRSHTNDQKVSES
jgi:hypothetical protein